MSVINIKGKINLFKTCLFLKILWHEKEVILVLANCNLIDYLKTTFASNLIN